MWNSFWAWYERTYLLNLSVALVLFLVQIAHLVWLSGDVVWHRLFGEQLLQLHGAPELVLILVDYTEIPALISVSLVYINELRKKIQVSSVLFLLMLNVQWLHLFWITDEFVVTAFNEGGTVLPIWLAWIAIVIDYLEVPVMIDTLGKFVRKLRTFNLA